MHAVNKAVKAVGTRTTGVDSTGKKYVYEVGHRGRVPVSDAKAAPAEKPHPIAAHDTSGNSKVLAAKILQAHKKWIKQPGNIPQRLRLLTANGRAEALSRAGSNPSEAHKALAQAILGTIFAGVKKEPGVKVMMSPGGKSVPGHITLKTAAGEDIGSVKFDSLHHISPGHIGALRRMIAEHPEPDDKMMKRLEALDVRN